MRLAARKVRVRGWKWMTEGSAIREGEGVPGYGTRHSGALVAEYDTTLLARLLLLVLRSFLDYALTAAR